MVESCQILLSVLDRRNKYSPGYRFSLLHNSNLEFLFYSALLVG